MNWAFWARFGLRKRIFSPQLLGWPSSREPDSQACVEPIETPANLTQGSGVPSCLWTWGSAGTEQRTSWECPEKWVSRKCSSPTSGAAVLGSQAALSHPCAPQVPQLQAPQAMSWGVPAGPPGAPSSRYSINPKHQEHTDEHRAKNPKP